MLKLYYTQNTCALASLIALEEAGADYEVVPIDFQSQQQRTTDYLAINPKGRVPALATDDGILTETPALLTFIAATHPQAGLAPTDPFQHARMQSINSYLCSTVHPAHAHRVRGIRWADDEAAIAELARKAPSVMADCFALIENELLTGPWMLGEQFSTCDPYLFTIGTWLEGDGVDISEFPKVRDHYSRMLERASVRTALAV